MAKAIQSVVSTVSVLLQPYQMYDQFHHENRGEIRRKAEILKIIEKMKRANKEEMILALTSIDLCIPFR